METTATKTTFPKYAAYKDSGVEWLGEIPEGWEISRLRNIFFFSKGLTITKENLQEKGIYCVNYGEIHSKFGFEVNPEIHELKCVSEEYLLSDSNSLLNNGDFVFADTSEDIEGSGNFTYLNSKIRTFAGYHTVIARLKTPVNERFVAYVITSQSFRNQIRRRVKGVKVFSITQSLLKTVNFWFPPKKEQTAIAAFLDDKTAKIDRVIAQKQQMIALLKERKQIIIQNAVTKGLDPTVKMKDSGVEWIGEIPEGWEVKRLKNLVTNIISGPFGSSLIKDEYVKLGFKIYGQEQVIPNDLTIGDYYITQRKFEKMKRYEIFENDILVSCVGTFGKIALVPKIFERGIINPRLIKMSPQLKDILPKYLHEVLLSDFCFIQFDRISRGGTMGVINIELLSKLILVLPPKENQENILNHIAIERSKIDQAITLQHTQIKKLKEYKATLIDSAVTGKIKIG